MNEPMQWFVINLGDASLSQPRLTELEQQLMTLYQQAGQPSNMLALYRHESRELHCQTLLFVSAALQQIAQLEGAIPCSISSVQHASYLAGTRASAP